MRSLTSELSNINEAADELLLLDDEDAASIPYKVGQVFVHFSQVVLPPTFIDSG